MFNSIADIAPTKLEMRCIILRKGRIGRYGVRNHILDVASMMFAEANLTTRAFSSGRTMIFYRAGDRVPRGAAEPPVDWLFSYFPSNEHIFIQRYLIGGECPNGIDT